MSIKIIPIKNFYYVFFTFIQNKKIDSKKPFLPKAKTKCTGPSKFIHSILTFGICSTKSITKGMFIYNVFQLREKSDQLKVFPQITNSIRIPGSIDE